MADQEHVRLKEIQAQGPTLLIGDRSIDEVMKIVGRTPFFVYDRRAIMNRVADLRAALPARVKIHYAIKANPMPELCAALNGVVDGFDVASKGELLVALNAGAAAETVGFAGPGKSDEDIDAALAAGITISVESAGELKRIEQRAAASQTPARVILRVNPDFQLKRSGVMMGGLPSQFGIPQSEISQLLASDVGPLVDIAGFHVFAGSQNLDAAALGEFYRTVFEVVSEWSSGLARGLRYLNVGGGFGIPYFAGDSALDIDSVGRAMAQCIERHVEALGSCNIIVELGRYLVGEAGYYVTRVLDVKRSGDVTYAVVDGGLHHHLANSGNFGQVIRRNYPVFAPLRLDEAATETVTVAGPLCTPLDIVAKDMRLPKLRPGDLVAVAQSGAYGASASPGRFLGHPQAGEILL